MTTYAKAEREREQIENAIHDYAIRSSEDIGGPDGAVLRCEFCQAEFELVVDLEIYRHKPDCQFRILAEIALKSCDAAAESLPDAPMDDDEAEAFYRDYAEMAFRDVITRCGGNREFNRQWRRFQNSDFVARVSRPNKWKASE